MKDPEILSLHKFRMLERRDRQLARVPDNDSRVMEFSKNSLPEYRKDYVRDCSPKSK